MRGLGDVLNLLTETWWTRAWMAQEFLAAQSAVFLVGYKHVPSQLILAIVVAFRHMDEVELSFPATELGTRVGDTWDSFQDSYYASSTVQLMKDVGSRARLTSVLDNCQFRRASDKRDMM